VGEDFPGPLLIGHRAGPGRAGIVVGTRLNPPDQYADDRNLRARQRLWQHQVPSLDVAGWVLGLGAAVTVQRWSRG
jgi:hypothetical protein